MRGALILEDGFYGVSASVDPLFAIVGASSAPIAFTYQ